MSATVVYNGRRYQLSRAMLRYCRYILARRGRDFSVCEQCGEPTKGTPELHHTRYEGATIDDLEIVCRRCNRLAENRGLA